MPRCNSSCGRSSVVRLILGLGVVLVGVLLILDNLDLVEAERYLRYWPLIPIAMGLAFLARRDRTHIAMGLFFMLFGGWFLLEEMDYIQITPWNFFWPIILVFVGTNLLLGAFRRRPQVSTTPGEDVRAFAFLSGIKRQGSAVNFRSADLAAFMGGVDLDLRNAKMTETEGVIDVFAFWGGIDILVPKDWSIESKVLPLLGGYEENLEQTVREGSPRLVIRGTVVMGGVEVKN